jgi:hypothetical protein
MSPARDALGRRLKAKADQIWLFTRNFAVPWTNNASEQAIKGPKRHQAVSGYWHSLATLARYCRVRSYLVTSRNHGIGPIDAIHAALTGPHPYRELEISVLPGRPAEADRRFRHPHARTMLRACGTHKLGRAAQRVPPELKPPETLTGRRDPGTHGTPDRRS